MKKTIREKRIDRAAAYLAWGKGLEEVASLMQVEKEAILEWMRTDAFRQCWHQRFSEYVRYLQGLTAAYLEEQVLHGDDKVRSSAAAAIMKLGEQVQDDGDDSVQVNFAMPAPGEVSGKGGENR